MKLYWKEPYLEEIVLIETCLILPLLLYSVLIPNC